ncbi:MAG: nucleotidyltransferase domain-containing protein [Elusimicrobia bacterium]|nr:nucleotidyltransferase domain-containing protein [Elusimicrobiota bacterium]
MTPQTAIDTAVSQVVASSHPSRIIMFGSRAQGTETADSDLDILVIERHISSKVKEMVRLRQAVGNIGMAVDIMVASEKEVEEWGSLPGTALYWAIREGKVLYEAPH